MLALRNILNAQASGVAELQARRMMAAPNAAEDPGEKQNIYGGRTDDVTEQAIKDAPGNVVRAQMLPGVYNTPQKYRAQLDLYARLARKYKKKLIVSDWGGTGKSDTASLKTIVDRWKTHKDFFAANTGVILNIANEWGGYGDNTTWRDAYKKYGKDLRDAGITNELMIDGNSGGQDPRPIITYGKEVADHIGGKVSFSVHGYDAWRDSKNTYSGKGWVGQFSIIDDVKKMKEATGRDIWFGEYGKSDAHPNPPFSYSQFRKDARTAGVKGLLLWGRKIG